MPRDAEKRNFDAVEYPLDYVFKLIHKLLCCEE
jgi:hypothetical protein